MAGTVHIVGAGLAGLAAAVRLSQAGRAVVVHEATGHAGGRCRSYHDRATGLHIDNGNHLLLSGNRDALAYAETIGAADRLTGPAEAAFPFHDLATGERWTVRINDGRLPWWILDSASRVPGTRPADYLGLARLLFAGDRPIGEVIACEGPLYDRLLAPLLVAALNTDPPVASAALAAAIVRETLGKGGEACRPRIAVGGLGSVFVEPAVDWLRGQGATVNFTHELRRLELVGDRVAALVFGADRIDLAADDAVILAVPAWIAAVLVPEISVPQTHRSILNTHFRVRPPAGMPPLLGVIGGAAEWIFRFADRVSVTTSNADRFMREPRELLAEIVWREVCRATGLDGPLPPWQIVRERRATFAATPEEDARRPAAATRWQNLALAGDWTATGLPATIEGAIRSGNAAAALFQPRRSVL
ncbi:Phytoene desaturase [Rhodovulum sp. PH10]|uniref:hydroxysqualene dehydroxylase HpnE n=1 Tax=Rhodovulum sp. PH10 TaxID=1187851 RepID=UPI00027C299E|nr:hydroxysqualene dehydroxylase HpnE [Rhodovulum sp. PH10]EJW13282.1 Phytoene desaturase [Rhodovulum sp. PH10]